MNFNGNFEFVNHSIAIKRNKKLAAKYQQDFNAKRMNKVEKALATRPILIPLCFKLNAAGQITPYTERTVSLSYDVTVIGFMADSSRDVQFRRAETDSPFLHTGGEQNLYLTLDEIAGGEVISSEGQTGIFYFPTPLELDANRRLIFDVYKTDDTPDPQEVNIVLIGIRTYPSVDTLLSKEMRDMVNDLINFRKLPEFKFIKQKIEFETAVAGGQATGIYTPKVDEPLLIRGCRSTFNHSRITAKIEGESAWTVGRTPVWALAAQQGLVHENYNYFQRPVFLPPNTHIEMELQNGIGDLIDEQKGTITWLCETV